jgi:hypothetical protein
MEWEEIDLRELLACLRREYALRQRVYPRWVGKGSMTDKKAEKELELMRQCVDFLVDCIFKAAAAGKSPTVSKQETK